jgi:iron(III) transport system ATP-binding protein
MLHCNNIYKKIEKTNRIIANNISFTINDGQIFTILGESGAGKTTFLRMIAGFNNPDNGEIIINDNTVFKKGLSANPNKRDVGIIFQHNSLFPHMNAYENIEFAISNYSKAQKKLIIDNVIIKLNLFNLLHKYPNQLSGGEQQKIILARILCKNNKVLLLDEPFNALDKNYREEMRNIVKDIVHKYKLIAILVTHDQEEAFCISDQIAILKDGIFLQQDTPFNIYTNPNCEYVAKATGRANLVALTKIQQDVVNFLKINITNLLAQNKNTLLIRPENIIINSFNVDNNLLKAQIINITYFGSYYLIDIKIGDIFLQSISIDISFNINDIVFVKIKEFLVI